MQTSYDPISEDTLDEDTIDDFFLSTADALSVLSPEGCGQVFYHGSSSK